MYPEDPISFLKDVKNINGKWEEKRFYYLTKVYPIGKINLNPDFDTYIVKVVSFEATLYDIWNLSKSGKAISEVCLFWGLRDDRPFNEKVTFTIVDSKISKEGEIIWHENADGLETFRTYKLNSDGYFQVIKEEQKGKAEY